VLNWTPEKPSSKQPGCFCEEEKWEEICINNETYLSFRGKIIRSEGCKQETIRGIPPLEQHAQRSREPLIFCETMMTSGLLWNLT
jgi:hypothetical protein